MNTLDVDSRAQRSVLQRSQPLPCSLILPLKAADLALEPHSPESIHCWTPSHPNRLITKPPDCSRCILSSRVGGVSDAVSQGISQMQERVAAGLVSPRKAAGGLMEYLAAGALGGETWQRGGGQAAPVWRPPEDIHGARTLSRPPVWLITGAPRSQETALPQDPTVGICRGPYGGPREGGCFS